MTDNVDYVINQVNIGPFLVIAQITRDLRSLRDNAIGRKTDGCSILTREGDVFLLLDQ